MGCQSAAAGAEGLTKLHWSSLRARMNTTGMLSRTMLGIPECRLTDFTWSSCRSAEVWIRSGLILRLLVIIPPKNLSYCGHVDHDLTTPRPTSTTQQHSVGLLRRAGSLLGANEAHDPWEPPYTQPHDKLRRVREVSSACGVPCPGKEGVDQLHKQEQAQPGQGQRVDASQEQGYSKASLPLAIFGL